MYPSNCIKPSRAASALYAIGVLFSVTPIWAQLPDEAGKDAPPQERQAAADGVYLNDSFEARELIQESQAHLSAGEWEQAIAQYRQTLSQFGRHVILQKNGTYTSIRHYVNDQMADWPAEALAAFEATYGPSAESHLQQAVRQLDPDTLAWILEEYYPTRAALRAGDALAQTLIESGNFRHASTIYERLLYKHPLASSHQNELWSKYAVSLALDGRASEAETLLQETKTSVLDYELSWKGTRSRCADVLKELQSAQPVDAFPSESANWPTYRGSNERNRVPAHNPLPTAPLWKFDKFTPSTLRRPEGYFQSGSFRAAYEQGKYLVLEPVVSDNMIFLSDAIRIWAVDLETGTLKWEFQGITDDDDDGGWRDRIVSTLHGCSTANGYVYAELGENIPSYYAARSPRNRSVLVCLEAATGSLVWQVTPGEMDPDPEDLRFEGPPMVDQSGIYIVVRRHTSFGFEDCYLWKLDHRGAEVWRTHIGSASAGGFGVRKPTRTIPSLVGGIVYVQSNLGSLAAIDTITGLTRWITTYPSKDTSQSGNERASILGHSAWHYAPMLPMHMTSEDQHTLRLVSSPLDSDALIIIDAREGRITNQISRTSIGDCHTLIGIVENRLYAVGTNLFCYDLQSGSEVWSTPLSGESLLGRPTMSREQIILPTDHGLEVFDVAGSPVHTRTWDEGVRGGNVITLPGKIILASNEQLIVYGQREEVYAKLKNKMEQAPNDPLPALRLAETAYRTAVNQTDASAKQTDYELGTQSLQTAIERAGGFATTWDPPLKKRVFDSCLFFAECHLGEEPPQFDRAIELYQIAAQCPPEPADVLLLKLKLATAYVGSGLYAMAVEQCQHILEDRSLRVLPWPEEDASYDAERAAREWIAELIQERGRSVYKKFEDRSAAMLATALQASDLSRLTYISEAMPNSLAAPQALVAKARLLSSQDQHAGAARAYFAAMMRYPNQVDRAELLLRIAQCQLNDDQPEHAIHWLEKAAREYPQYMFIHENQTLDFDAYGASIRSIHGSPDIARPTCGQKLLATHRLDLGPRDVLLPPLFAEHPDANWSHAYLLMDGSICAYDPNTGRTIWHHEGFQDLRPEVLVQLQNVIVVASQFQILGLSPADGKLLWQVGRRPVALNEPLADPENFPPYHVRDLHQGELIAIRSNGHAVSVDTINGHIRWQRQLEHPPAGIIDVGPRWVIYNTRIQNCDHILILDAHTGQLLHQIKLSDTRPTLSIQHTPVGSVLVTTSQSVSAINPTSGEIEWQREFETHLPLDHLHVVLDGLILTTDHEHMVKIDLDRGQEIWQSEPLHHIGDPVVSFIEKDLLYLVTERRVLGLELERGAIQTDARPPKDRYWSDVCIHPAHLGLFCRSYPQNDYPIEYGYVLLEKSVRTETHFSEDDQIPLGSSDTPRENFCYDLSIISQDQSSLQCWVTDTE